MRRLTTRGRAVAEAIARHETFTTHGALRGREGYESAGRLAGDDRDAFNAVTSDSKGDPIVYSVYSYSTPIAWVLRSGAVYIVKQKFSRTTTKHQGNLYLLKSEVTP